MKIKMWKKCDNCGKLRQQKKLKYYKGEYLCNICYRRKITEMPHCSRTIPKHLIPKKRVEKPKIPKIIKPIFIQRKRDNTLPAIKPIRKSKRVSTKGLYISRNEKTFLFKKYQERLGNTKASQKVKDICLSMSNLVTKLKQEKKSKEQMQKIFVQELEKHIKET